VYANLIFLIALVGKSTQQHQTTSYIMHIFQKKSERGIETPKPDMDAIRSRLKQAKELASEQS